MLSKIISAVVHGIEGQVIEVEIDLTRGLPGFYLTGMADGAVKESGQRVKSAIINSGFAYTQRKTVVNLVPAYIYKKGSCFDLAIAVGILQAESVIPRKSTESTAFLGELRLDGRLSSVKGILAMIKALARDGRVKRVLIPYENRSEGALAQEAFNVEVVAVRNLTETVDLLWERKISSVAEKEPMKQNVFSQGNNDVLEKVLDFKDVKGQWVAKEALAIAVCGNHGIILMGPPGSGKTMLARRVPTILPKMSPEEKLETTMVYSVAGLIKEEKFFIEERPFREIDPAITLTGITGGGINPYPGEVSLAHNGVLFIDEFLEFDREKLEILRKPLEENQVRLVRGGQLYTFPAGFMMVGASNPCKCGYYGDRNHICTCTSNQLKQYKNKLSGPMADRIDMVVKVEPVDFNVLTDAEFGDSKTLLDMVSTGRRMQKKRFGRCNRFNGQMDENEIEKYCSLGKNEKAFAEEAFRRYDMSSRRYHKVLKVARTVADIEECQDIKVYHLASAFKYTLALEEERVREDG